MKLEVCHRILRGALATVLLLLPLSPSFSSGEAAPRCAAIFVPRLPDARIYAKGVDSKNPDTHFQFAYESEYLLNVQESARLLRDYKPQDISLAEWQGYTDEQRVGWLKIRFPHKPELPSETGLKKINHDLPFMPDELIVDSTGNVEIVLMPFDTFAQWSDAIDKIVTRYGRGSQQAMVSKHSSSYSQANLQQHLGWLIFSNQFDMFQKLKAGWERYQKDPTKLSVQSFDHPFVGPMTRLKRETMQTYLSSTANGEVLSQDQKNYVRRNDASFKFTGGPSYRPDIAGPVRWSWELRSSHKDVEDLKSKMLRDVAAHVRGLEIYERFAQMQPFDSIESFERLSDASQALLKSLFPSKADPRIAYDPKEHLALETFRNFALPVSGFAGFPEALGRTPAEVEALRSSIRVAAVEYTNALSRIAANYAAGQLTPELARAEIMGQIGKFAIDSGLVDAFEAMSRKVGDQGLTFPEILELAGHSKRR